MKTEWLTLAVLFWTGAQAQSFSSIPRDVPLFPDPALTPGSLCQSGRTLRYPERIRYCERKVDGEEKDQVFSRYSQRYDLKRYNRHQFKMDHLIPLCMGGSNESNNLWPQHHSISPYTDKIEDLLCKGMRMGKVKQAAAVQQILQAKRDLSLAQKMRASLEEAFGP